MSRMRSIGTVVANGLCVGCGVCTVACPQNAISMKYYEEVGMLAASIETDRCTECGRCLHVCFGFGVDESLHFRLFHRPPPSPVGYYTDAYMGFANDRSLRFNASSGGVVSAILAHALQENLIDGAIVTKMTAGNPPRAKAFVATSPEEVLLARGSKYCPVSLSEALSSLKDDRQYAVVGLPCHIYGVRRLAEINPKVRAAIRLYVGLLCGLMPSYLGTEYILRSFGLENKYVRELDYRGGGWPGRLRVLWASQGQSGEVVVPYPDYWQGRFQYFQPFRCTLCHDGFNQFADISCGDAWQPAVAGESNAGLSLVIARRGIGVRLVRDAIRNGVLHADDMTLKDIVKLQRGLVRYKVSTLKSRMVLYKAIGRTIPYFDSSSLPEPSLASYVLALELYVGRALASRRKLWGLFNLHVRFVRALGGLAKRLRS